MNAVLAIEGSIFQRSDMKYPEHLGWDKIDYLKAKYSSKRSYNVLFILNESLGKFASKKSDETMVNSPFYNTNVCKKKDVYFDIRNARSISGDTITASPGVLTGQFIASSYDSIDVKHFFEAPMLAKIARALNYSTSLFCSYDTFYQGTWQELGLIFSLFEKVVSKTTLKEKSVNDLGMDDRIITKRFLEWIEEQDFNQPFFSHIVWNNMHSPFFVPDLENFTSAEIEKLSEEQKLPVDVYRYQKSLQLTDDMLKSIINGLKKKNFLENTLIVFMADHGETPGKTLHRLNRHDSEVAAVPLWFRIPKNVLSDEQLKHFSLNAKERAVSNLDVVPTIAEILKWNDGVLPNDFSNWRSDGAITRGVSLLQPLPENRVIQGWQGSPFGKNCPFTHGMLANISHALFLHPSDNQVTLEEVTSPNYNEIVKSASFSELSKSDQVYWIKKLKQSQGMVDMLLKCGLSLSYLM